MDVRVSDEFVGRLLEEEAALATENEQLWARIAELEQLVKRHVKVEQQMQQENERLRAALLQLLEAHMIDYHDSDLRTVVEGCELEAQARRALEGTPTQ